MPAQQHIPDILDCLAQLSNDEVPTPPVLARAMLDLLPAEVWSEPDYKWLDPGCKSGVFLREAAVRLLDGLSDWEPDFEKRREHIFREMLWGAAITEMTGHIARRSVYCSRDASGEHSVVTFASEGGNIPFVATDHEFKDGKCVVCRAPEELERGATRENYAYSFIHGTYPTEEIADMKFDVIVGNPPYQVGMRDQDGERKTNIPPVYHYFVDQARRMDPRYLLMITPSRWFSGGKGLDEFRRTMIADRRIRVLVDNPKLFDCFPGQEIKGGVSYFLWDREHDGDCEFSTRIDGTVTSTETRDLREGAGVVLRDNKAAKIVHRVVEHHRGTMLSGVVSSRDPFGQAITAKTPSVSEPFDGSIALIYADKVGYVEPETLQRNQDWVDKYKVLLPKASDGHGREVSYVLGEPIALAPGSACTYTYLVAGVFESKDEAANYAHYLTTKFVRFLVLQRKTTHNGTREMFQFVPLMDMGRRWTDEALYEHFELTDDERKYIEDAIQPRAATLALDSPVPSSHLPGGNKYKAPA